MTFRLYSFSYIIPKITLSCFNSRMLKFIIILHLLISICISPVSKLIIPSLYSTSSPEIMTNKESFSFSLCSIPNYSTTFSVIWFLIALLSTIILNCFVCHLTLKFKYLLIVPLRVYSLFTSFFASCRPDFFPTVSLLLANIWSFFFFNMLWIIVL